MDQNSLEWLTTAPNGRELYHFHFSLQTASPETFGYTLVDPRVLRKIRLFTEQQ
jgi:hypothetical protein